MNENLKIISGQQTLRFNRFLTEKEYNKLVKSYRLVGWYVITQFNGTNDFLTCEKLITKQITQQ